MAESLREFLRRRAEFRCEYCHLAEQDALSVEFPVEHIRAKQHGGNDLDSNLAYSCQRCNSQKGPNQSGFDPETNTLIRLFHSRIDYWHEHFEMSGPVVIGMSAEGRATVELLQMNDERRVQLRAAISDSDSP